MLYCLPQIMDVMKTSTCIDRPPYWQVKYMYSWHWNVTSRHGDGFAEGLALLLACCCPSMNDDEDAVLARKQTDGGNEDDSGAGILTRRFCHRYVNEDRMLEYLSCVDERDVLLPSGRSWYRKPADPPRTHLSTVLCQMPVSRADQEVLSTSNQDCLHVIWEALLLTAGGSLAMLQFGVQNATWEPVGLHPNDMTNPSELAQHDQMFHAVSVGPASHLGVRDVVPPVKTENFLQWLSVIGFKSFEVSTDDGTASRFHSQREEQTHTWRYRRRLWLR